MSSHIEAGISLIVLTVAETWGSTAAERSRSYPCDGMVALPRRTLFRAVDVDAPAAVTFRWLCQLRIAPYSYDWIDNFGRRSPRRLIDGLDALAVGQRVMGIFRLAAFDPPRHITLVLDSPSRRFFGDLAVTYEVVPRGDASRIVVKLVVRDPGRPFRWAAPLLPWGDLVMMRKQLLTLKALAEASS